MPSCGVLICKNRSNVSNYQTCGVTYHQFPKDPILKEKWIHACGRKETWFPTKNGVICSLHFTEECFQLCPKKRKLFPDALPTLKLRVVYDTVQLPTSTEKEKPRVKKKNSNPNKMATSLERYKIQIEKYKQLVKAKDMKIKRLQQMVRRCRRKIESMNNVLTALKNENIIGEDHFWLMESDSITKVKIITPKN